MRLKHDSLRTEQAYVYWIRRYIHANDRRHPRELDGVTLERFLSVLATRDARAKRPRWLQVVSSKAALTPVYEVRNSRRAHPTTQP